ncbi:hypothetical protein BDSB_02450 [Burkholderia dolosa PC543]|nr:hypothetical protein BDSB_02450 [Burkholderia dolosa PC543]
MYSGLCGGAARRAPRDGMRGARSAIRGPSYAGTCRCSAPA